MRVTGIVRKVDQLGRIVIPSEVRKVMGIKIGDPIDIYSDGKQIILSKYEPYCMVCGEVKDLVQVNGTRICKKCLDKFISRSACDESK